jgi:dynein heavy chain
LRSGATCTAAKALAKKFAALYYLLEDLLSPQKHYDWSLRAIKSVLVVAGGLLRSREGQDEQDVLFRALRWVMQRCSIRACV